MVCGALTALRAVGGVALAAALVAAACGPAGPRTLELDLVEIQVTVIDETGFVEQVMADFGPKVPGSPPRAVNPGERPDVLRVSWMTRACGHSTLRLASDGERLRITARTPLDPDCTNDIGVVRSIRLVLDRRIDAATVDVEDLGDG